MHRFYCQNADFTRTTIIITDKNELHHIRDVLRLKAGQELAIFNGRNQEALAVITSINATEVKASIQSVKEKSEGSRTKIILACAVPKKAKFEFIIEKCTELGADEIIPLKTKRTEVVFAKDKLAPKQARFQKVAVNAAKQSGRSGVPQIHPMTPLTEVLKLGAQEGTMALIPSLNDRSEHIRDVLMSRPRPKAVVVLIGPEGDFTPDEVKLSIEQGCVPVSLGATVLKVDTAAVSSIALVRFFYTD